MSLKDLVSVALASRFEPENRLTPRERATAAHNRWLAKPGNRARFNAYRRRWWAARKKGAA